MRPRGIRRSVARNVSRSRACNGRERLRTTLVWRFFCLPPRNIAERLRSARFLPLYVTNKNGTRLRMMSLMRKSRHTQVFLPEICQSARRLSKSDPRSSFNEPANRPGGEVGGEGWREIPGNPIKIGAISRGEFRDEGARPEFKRRGCHAVIMSIYFFFFSFFLSSPFFPPFLFLLFSNAIPFRQRVARKLRTTNPGDFARWGGGGRMTCGGVSGGGSVSSNSFGKASSSVKIKGNRRAVYRRAACSGGGHLRTELSPCRDENLLAIRVPLPLPRREYILRL